MIWLNFTKKKDMILQLLFLYKMTKFLTEYAKFTMTSYKILQKKPEKNYLANTGFYVVNPKVFNLIKSNENISFVDLINKALAKRMKIEFFPISNDSWVDLGQSIDFIRKIND